MSNEKRHIFLIGSSGVGKTTVGRLVAQLSNMEFIDLDDAIEQRIGITIHEYFEQFGEAEFREREREALKALASESEPKVYATGGGTVLDTRNIIDMRNNGNVVYLNAFEADIIERIKADGNNARPLIQDNIEENVRTQFLARRECYELAADITIATSRRDVDAVADAVIRQCNRMSGSGTELLSSIVVGDDVLGKMAVYVTGYPEVVLLSQESIPEKYRQLVQASFEDLNVRVVPILVPDGEEAKSMTTYEKVINEMAVQLVKRSACVVALGGGVVGDLGGFVASTYHRGIDVVQVPTTLLAQVDSSLGGKCGINLESGKNLVGSFHQPKVVVADTSTLASLPDDDFLSGLGEVAKYALLGNTAVADVITKDAKKILARDASVLVPVIRSCMNHKIQVVARDPFERTGVRATLNLGHTLGHAIEKETGFSIAHGVAVAIGLHFAAQLSCDLGRIPESQKDAAFELLGSLGLEKEMPEQCRDIHQLVDLMYSDKKSDGGLSMILLNLGGGAELVHDVDRVAVETSLARFIG